MLKKTVQTLMSVTPTLQQHHQEDTGPKSHPRWRQGQLSQLNYKSHLLQVLFLCHFMDFVKTTLVTFDQNVGVIEWQGTRDGEEVSTVTLDRRGGGIN